MPIRIRSRVDYPARKPAAVLLTIRRAATRNDTAWTATDDAMLRKLWGQNSQVAIMKIMRRDHRTVKAQARRLGLV